MAEDNTQSFDGKIKGDGSSLDETCIDISVVGTLSASDDEKLKKTLSQDSDGSSHPSGSDSGILVEGSGKASQEDDADYYDDDDDLDKPQEKRVDVYFIVMATILVGILFGSLIYFAISPRVEIAERTFAISIVDDLTTTTKPEIIVTTMESDSTVTDVTMVTTMSTEDYYDISYELDYN